LELRELKARSTLLGACISCPLLRSDLEAAAIEIKDLKHKLDHSSSYTVLSPPCETCVSLKGTLFHATKENTELQQEVAYLTARPEKTALSEKMIKEDLSWVEESATKSTYKLSVGFERCEKKGEKSASKIVPSSSYHKEEEALKSTKAHYPSNLKPSFNPQREARKETPKLREKAFVCMFCGHAGHLDEFCFRRKKIERRRVEYARDSYRERRPLSHVFYLALLLLLCLSSLMDPTITHMVLVHENHFEPRRFGYRPRPHRGDCFPHRPGFTAGGSFIHFEPRHLDGPCFLYHGSRPTRPSGEVQRTMKTSSGCMVKCWIPKIYLTNHSTEPSTFSRPM
jgi:hypothetical protein